MVGPGRQARSNFAILDQTELCSSARVHLSIRWKSQGPSKFRLVTGPLETRARFALSIRYRVKVAL